MCLSKDNNFAICRGKKKKKYICINDDTDYIIIRNGLKNVQIYAEKDIEMIANGNVKIKAAGNFDVSAGGTVNIRGSDCKIGPTLRTKDLKRDTISGTHLAIDKPLHPNGPAPACGTSPSPASPTAMQCKPLKPQDFDKERGCDPTKSQKGPVDPSVVHCGPGQGGRNDSPPQMDSDGNNPDVFDPTDGPPDITGDPSAGPPPAADPVVDPIDGFSGTGVLWFGTSCVFEDDISINGLQRLALSNPINDPDDPAEFIPLAISESVAEGDKFAGLSVQKYGGNKLIIRVVAVDDGDLLERDPDDNEVIRYKGDSIRFQYLEVFDEIVV